MQSARIQRSKRAVTHRRTIIYRTPWRRAIVDIYDNIPNIIIEKHTDSLFRQQMLETK